MICICNKLQGIETYIVIAWIHVQHRVDTCSTWSSYIEKTQRSVAFILPCPKADFSNTRPPMMRPICHAGVCSHTGKMNS